MKKKIESLFYGGKSRQVFLEHKDSIDKYNSKVLSVLLKLMSSILIFYIVYTLAEKHSEYYIYYVIIYTACLAALLLLHFIQVKLGAKHLRYMNVMMFCFCTVMLILVCFIGTVMQPHNSAVMFVVYMLTAPMIVILPTHITYGYLSGSLVIFSVLAVIFKEPVYYINDILHGITSLIIGFFISKTVLQSRISLLCANSQLSVLSKLDPLTGLANRRGLDEYIAGCSYSSDSAAAMIDIDDFKKYNDLYGHQCGDYALRYVSGIIGRHAAENGCCSARYGGEEFIIINPHTTETDFRTMLDTIRSEISKYGQILDSDDAKTLTVSIGYVISDSLSNTEQLIKLADKALYIAKNDGKNCVRRA